MFNTNFVVKILTCIVKRNIIPTFICVGDYYVSVRVCRLVYNARYYILHLKTYRLLYFTLVNLLDRFYFLFKINKLHLHKYFAYSFVSISWLVFTSLFPCKHFDHVSYKIYRRNDRFISHNKCLTAKHLFFPKMPVDNLFFLGNALYIEFFFT